MTKEGYGIEFNANKVRRLIAQRGWTYSQFAEKLGWANSQLCQVLKKGRARPNTLDYMCYVLGCSIANIMFDDDGIEKIKVKLSPGGIMPTRAHNTDAGLDLYSPVEVIVPCKDKWHSCSAEIDTLTHIAIPVGYVGDVKSKSGLMMKYGVVTDGTVDAGYTGSVRVKLFNHGLCDVKIQKGQKIAQLVIKKIITPELELVDSLEETERGDNGFGSTGKF
jgi:dUTP pyrophosphatase